MRTKIIDNKWGCLNLRTSSFGDMILQFPVASIPDWYPLNVNYVYKYSEAKDVLYLCMIDDDPESHDYGIHSNLNRVTSPVATFSPKDWDCARVKLDNEYVMRRASNLGLKTFNDTLTSAEIHDNIKKLGDLEMSHLKGIRSRVREKFTKADWNTFLRLDQEDKDTFVLNRATYEEKEMLRLFGKIHSMYYIMLKISKAK